MKTINNSKNYALVAVATLGVALSAGAHADEVPFGAGSRTVQYADLNLNTAAGAKVLYKRIRSAALQVCGDVGSRRLEEAAAAKACVDQAIVASVRAVNSAQLALAAHAQDYPVQTLYSVAAVL